MLCIHLRLIAVHSSYALVKPEWWEKHQAHAVILWSLLLPFRSRCSMEHQSRRDGTGVSDRWLSDLYRVALWTVLRSRKYQAGGKSGRQPKGKRYHACCWNFFSSCIGTTGASMLFVRPIIQMTHGERTSVTSWYFSFFLCQISEDVLHLSEIRRCSWDFQEEYRSSGAWGCFLFSY